VLANVYAVVAVVEGSQTLQLAFCALCGRGDAGAVLAMGAVREYAVWYGGAEGDCGKACEEGDDTGALHCGDLEIADRWCRSLVGRVDNVK